MKITIDKHFTTLEMVDRTKQQAKEFKEIYTDGDLLRMFRDAIDRPEIGYSESVLYCNLEAFPGGTMQTDETHYHVEMLLEGWKAFTKLSFYISHSGEINTRTIYAPNLPPMSMYTVERYELKK